MRAVLGFCALALLSLSPAQADQATDHTSFCGSSSSQTACHISQASFLKDFPLAYKGDYQAQRNVAFCLQDGCNGAVQPNATLACAWRLVIAASGSNRVDNTDISNLREYCGTLDDVAREAAKLQARRLAGMILGRRR